MQSNTIRYAIYWAPSPDSALGRFGNSWLGRDPAGGPVDPRKDIPGLTPAEIETLTQSPARYGFHATLKPPFALAEEYDEEMLLQAVRAHAQKLRPVDLGPLAVQIIGAFIAIMPDAQPPALEALAAACVRELDPLRALPAPGDLARRRRVELTPDQDALLAQWGYPYVMQEFRFHMTLTGPLTQPERDKLRAALSDTAAGALGAVTVTELCVFTEPAPDAPFRLIARFPLAGS